MLALLAVVVVVVESGALHVDKAPDKTLPCPANAALEQAVKVRLPKVKLGRGKPAANDLIAVITGTAGAFRFEVRKPDGSIAMSRDLFSGCAQLGDTSALILERYLAAISWSGRDVGLVPQSPPVPVKPTPPPEPPPPLIPSEPDAGVAEPDTAELISRIGVTPEPTGSPLISAPAPPPFAATPDAGAPPEPDAGSAPVINLPPPPAAEPVVSSVELSAGGGVWYGDGFVGSFSLDLGLVFRERLRVAVLALTGLPVTRAVGDGRGAMQWLDFQTLVAIGPCTRGELSLCGHLVGGARFTWATASTDPNSVPRLSGTQSGVFALPTVGGLVRVGWAFARHFFIALDVLLAGNLGTGRVEVKGFSTQARDTPSADFSAQGRLGVRL